MKKLGVKRAVFGRGPMRRLHYHHHHDQSSLWSQSSSMHHQCINMIMIILLFTTIAIAIEAIAFKIIYYYQQDLRVHMFEVTKDEAKEVTNLVGFVWARFEFQSTYFEFQSTYCKINISCFPTMNIVNIISFIILTGNGDTGIRPLWAENETIGQILPDCIW